MSNYDPSMREKRADVPHGRWKTTTFTARLQLPRIAAPMLFDGRPPRRLTVTRFLYAWDHQYVSLIGEQRMEWVSAA